MELIERIINKGGTVFKSLSELMDTEELYQITIPYQPEVHESVLTEMLLEAGIVVLNAEIHNVEVWRMRFVLYFFKQRNSETTTSRNHGRNRECAFIANGWSNNVS